jgi:hypothetical protein
MSPNETYQKVLALETCNIGVAGELVYDSRHSHQSRQLIGLLCETTIYIRKDYAMPSPVNFGPDLLPRLDGGTVEVIWSMKPFQSQ